MAEEPLDLADIKRHLVLDPDDSSEDAYLSSMIVAARRACELRTRRTIVGEDRTLVMPAFPPVDPILLGWGGSSPAARIAGSADVVLTGGSVMAVTVNYFADDGFDTVLDEEAYFAALDQVPALLRPVANWPGTQARPDAVRIEYTLSPLEAADLEMVRHAIRLIVAHWYANREAVAPDGRAIMDELPLAVSWLLAPLVSFAVD